MPELALVGRELVVEYRSGDYVVRPVDGVSFEVGGGELALLLGASGCGKTTLLSVLAGILRPTGGTVTLGDVAVTTLRARALLEYRRTRVGVVFQAFNLIPSLSASENVQVPLRAAGVRPREARARADALLERFGLGDRRGHRPSALSGGQQQRVAIARALALDPPLVLADEPTAHLDYLQVESVLRALREIADEGRMVVVSTHDERLVPLADRVVAMSPRTIAEGDAVYPRRLEDGEVLFHQGDAGDLVFLVTAGAVDLVRERADGGEEPVAQVTSGGYFGELAPLLGIRRSATARAAGPTEVLGLTPAEFRRRRAAGRSAGAEAPTGAGSPSAP